MPLSFSLPYDVLPMFLSKDCPSEFLRVASVPMSLMRICSAFVPVRLVRHREALAVQQGDDGAATCSVLLWFSCLPSRSSHHKIVRFGGRHRLDHRGCKAYYRMRITVSTSDSVAHTVARHVIRAGISQASGAPRLARECSRCRLRQAGFSAARLGEPSLTDCPVRVSANCCPQVSGGVSRALRIRRPDSGSESLVPSARDRFHSGSPFR